jgi:hypothetical protein
MSFTVSITPSTAGPIVQGSYQTAATPRKTQKFIATTNDPAGVVWAVAQGGGAITPEGVFYPPIDYTATNGKSTVSATCVSDKTKVATAVVTYRDGD